MMNYQTMGLLIAIPTFSMALYLVISTRNLLTLFFPNLSVLFWISANVWWMCGEFFEFEFKPACLILFISGVIAITYHFIKVYKRAKFKPVKETLTNDSL